MLYLSILILVACTYTAVFFYPVNISEMDIRTAGLDTDIMVGMNSHLDVLLCGMAMNILSSFISRVPPQYRDNVAAEIYRDTLRAALSQPCFDGVTFWYGI